MPNGKGLAARLLSAGLSLATLGGSLGLPVWACGQSEALVWWETALDSTGALAVWLEPSAEEASADQAEGSDETEPEEDEALPVMAAPTLEALMQEAVTEQAPAAQLTSGTVPPKQDGGGTVIEETIGGGTAIGQGVFIKNTSGNEADWASLLTGEVTAFQQTDEPQVLIIQTHTTESYMSYYAGYYNDEDVARSTDCSANICAVGEVLANRLRAAGIGVIHDTQLYDSPEYTGAYGRSSATVESVLAQYPSICLVIDLHRDAVLRDSVTRIKPTATIDGQKAAQMMLVLGANDTVGNENPDWETNVRLGFRLASYLSGRYEGLVRPVSLTQCNYNQNLCSGASLLIEIGTDVNTFSEAMVTASLVGDALAAVMTKEEV